MNAPTEATKQAAVPDPEVLRVRVEFVSAYREEATRFGFGTTVDEAVADALRILCGPDVDNEQHGWVMNDWQAA